VQKQTCLAPHLTSRVPVAPPHHVTLHAPVLRKQVKHLRHNLQIILRNPNHSFKTDPNGFVMPFKLSEAELAAAADKAKAAEAAVLESKQGSLFDHLLQNVLGEQQQPAGAADAAPAASLAEQMNQLHSQQKQATKGLARPWASIDDPSSSSSSSSNGNGNGNGDGKHLQQQQPACAAAVLPPEAQAEKAAFLAHYRDMYGYGGQLDELYPCEVRVCVHVCV
jgi:hypothetical protein